MNDELREQLADVQHEIWAHWMRYQFSQCRRPAIADDGSLIIPTDKVERWTRQMNTPYSDLTDKEQESDRHQADKVLAVVRADIAAANARVQELESALAVAGQRGWHKEALDTLAVNMQQGQEIDQLRADLAAAVARAEALEVQERLAVADISATEQRLQADVDFWKQSAQEWKQSAQEWKQHTMRSTYAHLANARVQALEAQLAAVLPDFYSEVCAEAERIMASSGMVSGAHWNAMRIVLERRGVQPEVQS